MAITLVRIDDRVIHGQTITRWAGAMKCDALIVISDSVANDELRKKVLKAAASGKKLGIYNVEQGVAALEKAKQSPKSFFIITDSPKEFAALKRAGGDFGNKVNIGNMSGTRPGMKNVGHAVCLTDQDVEDFDYLVSQGIELSFQLIPDDSPRDWASVKGKYQSA